MGIEPSFGVDRILFYIFEHSYYAREKVEGSDDKQTRGVLRLSPVLAPYKVCVLPLDQRISRDERYVEIWSDMRAELGKENLSYTADESGATLGKRYARNDELGIPFAVTVDFDSFNDAKGTLRERDSCTQIRLPLSEVTVALKQLVSNECTWSDLQEKYPEQQQTASDKV